MKYLLPLLCIILSLPCAAQDSTIALSRFEVFSNRPGKLIKTESRDIGDVGPMTIAKVTTSDITSGKASSAIKIYRKNNFTEVIDPAVLYIEMSEVDTVISALNYFLEETGQTKSGGDLYYSYTTLDDVEFSVSYFNYNDARTFRVAKIYQTLRTKIPASVYSFNKKKAGELIELLMRAKEYSVAM